MKTRINIAKVEPTGYNAILGLEKFIESTPLTRTHKEQRIYALNAWRDTPFFSEEEQVILALTEEVTLISNHVADETYEQAEKVLGETYLAQVILAIITINAWNRIGITTKLMPV
jgi:alkylhydroperoxidase family enzyme